MFENIDDQLFVNIDPMQIDLDKIIFKENDIEDINILFETPEYIKELEKISLKDMYEIDNILNEYISLENKSREIDVFQGVGNLITKPNFVKRTIGRVLRVIKAISMPFFNVIKGTVKLLLRYIQRGRKLGLNTRLASATINIRAVIALLIGYYIAVRFYFAKRNEKKEYKNKQQAEEDRKISFEINEDKQIKVIKHNDLLKVISSYENVLRACEKMLDNVAIFKYGTLDEMNKEVSPQDLSVLQLSLEGNFVKRERLRMERNTVSKLGYSTDINKYENMRQDILLKHENFLKKEVSFVPKTHSTNTNVRQMVRMVRTIDNISSTSFTIALYHTDRIINSLKYIS